MPLDRLITRYEFADINRAAADATSGAAIKPVLLDAAVTTSPAFLKVRLRIGLPDIVRAQDPLAPKVAVGLFKDAILGSTAQDLGKWLIREELA